jgi:hypothetical protein
MTARFTSGEVLMKSMSRRDALGALATAGALVVAGTPERVFAQSGAASAAQAAPLAYAGKHEIVPLPLTQRSSKGSRRR